MSCRVVHCRKDRYDVLIDRSTPWGNPFTHLPLGNTVAQFQVETRAESIVRFEDWVRLSGDPQARWIREHVHELEGLTLGCWCAPQSCHGGILAKMADGGENRLPW